jgi:NAD(P)-dependent dehydrogenase (short-subunit alcohol dehydrogenase family)
LPSGATRLEHWGARSAGVAPETERGIDVRALLTGASTGIGQATVARLVAAGHEVVTLDIKDAPEGSTRHVHCDLSEPASIDAAMNELEGPFDALCNIAGVAGSMGAELVLRVNVYGLRHLTEGLLATGAIARGGSIVSVASLAGRMWERHLDRIAALDAAEDFAAGIEVAKAYERGGPTAYVLSKEWVVAYTQRLAGRVLSEGIRVNCVSPGPVDTPLFPYFEKDAGPELMAWMNRQIGRAATPDDQAQVIAWLAVGDSGWVNGVDLPVDGGLSAGLRVGWANLDPRSAGR